MVDAKHEDIERLAERVKGHMPLCQLFEGTPNACEAETMVAQTLRACAVNLATHGEAYSIRGDGVFSRSGGGLVDNASAYQRLLDMGYFREDTQDGKPAIFVKQALVNLLDGYFADRRADHG